MSSPFKPARFLLPVCLLSVWSLMLAGSLAACTVMVRSNNAPQTPPAYYLRGRNLAALHAEAARLCPAGYATTREWQGYEGPDHGGLFKNLFAQAIDWFAPPAFDEAQMDVQCQSAASAVPLVAPQVAPPPASAPQATATPS